VLRDPSLLDKIFKHYLDAEKQPIRKAARHTAPLQKTLVAKCAAAQEDDSSVPSPDVRRLFPQIRGGQHEMSAACRGRGEPQFSCSTATNSPKLTPFQFAGSRHSQRPQAPAWSADTKARNISRSRRDWNGNRTWRYLEETTHGVLERRLQELLLCQARRQPRPSRSGAIGWERRNGIARLRGTGSGWFTHRMKAPAGDMRDRRGDHRDLEQRLIDLRSRQTPRGAAREEACNIRSPPRRRTVHTSPIRRPIDFQIVHRGRGVTERAHWRDLIPHRAASMCRPRSYSGQYGAAGARQRAASIVIRNLASAKSTPSPLTGRLLARHPGLLRITRRHCAFLLVDDNPSESTTTT